MIVLLRHLLRHIKGDEYIAAQPSNWCRTYKAKEQKALGCEPHSCLMPVQCPGG